MGRKHAGKSTVKSSSGSSVRVYGSVTADTTKWQKLLAKATMTEVYANVGVLAGKGGDAQVDPRPAKLKKGEKAIELGMADRKAVQSPPPAPTRMTLVELAAIHEFGSPGANIPERSFLRGTMAAKEADIRALARKLTYAVVSTPMTPEHAVGLLGEYVSREIRNAIRSGEGIPPPNAASTIARKGSSRPLVDTGQLINAITYEIIGGEQRRVPTERRGGRG